MRDECESALGLRRRDLDAVFHSDFGSMERLVNVINSMDWYNSSHFADSLLSDVPHLQIDRLLTEHAALKSLAGSHPHLVFGPLDVYNQVWAGPADGPATPTNFRPVTNAAPTDRIQAKPWIGGLHTSTLVEHTTTWKLYADSSERKPAGPQAQWRPNIKNPIRVREIDSAAAWVTFVMDYPLAIHDAVYPDWATASTALDAVHVTLSGAVATHGFSFSTSQRPTAPIYWNCETTLWLNWSFDSFSLVAQR